MNLKRILSSILVLVMIISMMGVGVYASGNVAKVGSTEYATIDEAITNWTNGTTLTLLSDVTLSSTIELSSTEMHTLDLGTYTMVAVANKSAISILPNGRSSANYALDIKADSSNPGGISAPGGACIYSKGKEGVKDRPIIRIYGGNFTGRYAINHSGSNGTNCPQFQIYGGTFDQISTNRAMLNIYGGTFNKKNYISPDSSAYTRIEGGRFFDVNNNMFSALNADKWTYGTAKGTFDVAVYVDEDGYYVVEKDSSKLPEFKAIGSVTEDKTMGQHKSTLLYSKAAAEGIGYVSTSKALANSTNSDDEIVLYESANNDVKINGNLVIDMSASDADYTGNVTLNKKAATFTVIFDSERPYTGTVTPAAGYALKVTETMGVIVTRTYSNVECAVKIGNESFETLDAALDYALANGITKPEIEVLNDINFSTKLAQFEHVTFNGTNRNQTIDLNINSSFEANVGFTFNDLTVSRMDADWLYHYFYAKGGLKFNDCKMLGLYNVTAQNTDFINCDFYNDDTFGNGSYSIWLYNCADGVEVNITDCSFDVYERAIKMYGDGYNGEMTLNISGTEFISRTADKTVVEMAYANATTVGKMNLNITNSTKTGFGTPEHIDGEANAWFNVERSDNNYSNKFSTVKVEEETVYPYYAAKIDTEYYITLDDAFAAAENGETITLLNDATPSLTSQRAITNASVIDLNGHTLTLNEDDLYFGTTTFKNGEIVVAPGVSASTAVFWTFEGQTLEFNDIDIIATGVTGTYLLGTNGGTGAEIKLTNGSTITIDNATTTSLTAVIAGNSTYDVITIEDSTINVSNIEGRLALGGSYTVSGNTVINANGVKEGFYIRDGQSLSINDTANVSITLNPDTTTPRYGIHLNGVSTYNKADTATVNATNNIAAKIDDACYLTLQEAFDAVENGDTITLLDDITINANSCYNNGSWKDGAYYEGDESFTIDLNGHTVTQDGAVNDYLLLFKNAGSIANEINIKNGTLDAGATAFCALCTSSTSTQAITINLDDVNLIGNNPNGSVVKIRGGAILNANDGTVITGKDSYLGIENWDAIVNIYDGVKIYMNGTTSYNGCLVGVGGNGTINAYGGYGQGAKGGFIAMTTGGTINVSGGEWIADTDNTNVSGNNSVLIAQNGRNSETSWAGLSVVNITGGTFYGNYNCYGDVAGDAQINISSGYFTQDPTTYLVQGSRAINDAQAGLWAVLEGGHSIDIEATPLEVNGEDEVTVTVKVNGADFANAEWKLSYNKDVFEYADATTDSNDTSAPIIDTTNGVITDKLYTYAYGDVFKGNTILVTYKFKSKNQATDDVIGKFTLSDATVDTQLSSNYGTTSVDGDSAEVTVKLRDFGDLSFFERIDVLENEITSEIANNTYEFAYDGVAHNFTVKVANDTITNIDTFYTITKDGVAVNEIKGYGTYKINYTIEKLGYKTINKTLTVVVSEPEFELETSTYTLGNHTLIMVYTDAPGMTPTFAGKAMFDITASGYLYRATPTSPDEKFDFVYGIVVPDTAEASVTDLRKKVSFSTNTTTVIDPYNANVNFTGPVDDRDAVVVINTYGGYSEQMTYNLLSRILKADVTKDKVVNIDDITEIEKVIAEQNK